ncbi:hypothetical protein C8Q76DRAFT_634554 [Earliella scabrosa]|nr:hypothetical protein C8Q76DRAFT_634554 [Earliella scabrosa]
MPDIYTIIVRGEEFQLSQSQIFFDSPNYFTNCFSSAFAEAQERVLRLDRNPALFALIVEYLSGYPILPLVPDSLPPGMGMSMARRCLLADAEYFELKELRRQLVEPRLTIRTDLTWAGYANEVVSLHDVLTSNLPATVVRGEDGSIVSQATGESVLIVAHDVLFKFTNTGQDKPELALIPKGDPSSYSTTLWRDDEPPIIRMTDPLRRQRALLP